MEVSEAIKKRRSIRRFQARPIPEDVLEKLVEAGRLAPSGSNLQPWAFIIVSDKKMVGLVFPTLAWAGYLAPYGTPPEGRRPTAYIVVLQNKIIRAETPCSDLSAAIENILLLAVEEGLGGCWIGSVQRKKLAEILSIPESYYIDAVVALGYPDEESVVEEYKGDIKYWKDEREIMHVPKRPLKEVLYYNGFKKDLTSVKNGLK